MIKKIKGSYKVFYPNEILVDYSKLSKCSLNKEEITEEKLKTASLVFFGAPKDLFSKSEFEALKSYLEKGGNIFILLGEGGESK